jgi:chlorite dismutase
VTNPATSRPQAPARQWVSFTFYKLDRAFARLPDNDKALARQEILNLVDSPVPGLMCLSYSTVGLRGDVDFLLWRIGTSIPEVQQHAAAVNRTRLGSYLSTPWSFLSMTKRSMYLDKLDPSHTESRTHIVPGRMEYLFVYPFVKTRQWYLLPMEQRQQIMDEHIRVGNRFPSVKLNTTYSFGLDDQEFVVAFETDQPQDFLDLVMELRHTQGSLYTVRDTPIFTCVRMGLQQILQQLF